MAADLMFHFTFLIYTVFVTTTLTLKLHHSVLLSSSITKSNFDIVLLHGLLGSARNFNSFARLLHQKLEYEHNIIIIDLPSHGRSASTHREVLEYTSLAEDVIETLDYLSIDKVHVIGHSMGGKIASTLAIYHPHRVRSLGILDISPVEYRPEEFSTVSQLIQRLDAIDIRKQQLKDRNAAQSYLVSSIEDQSMIPFLMSNLQMNELGLLDWKFNLTTIVKSMSNVMDFPSPAESPPFEGPLLLIKGSRSNFVVSKHLNMIKSMFKQYTIVSIKDCGHWVHAEKPEEASELLKTFVKRFDKAGSRDYVASS